MIPYIPVTDKDKKYMLQQIGSSSVEELFEDIPSKVKLQRELNIDKGMSELELKKHITTLSKMNNSIEENVCFLGAGAYDHYIPAIVDHMLLRSEFYTAYTPYQPEISQGTLQVIFEYQSMICNLTGMEVSNASMYDGATALAEAAILAASASRRNEIIVPHNIHPEYIKVLKTYCRFRDIQVTILEDKDGTVDLEKLQVLLSKNTAAVIVQNPNFYGIIEDVEEIEKLTHANRSLLIMCVDPISLGILKTPGELGADIVVGDGQSLGNSLSFGGPYLGFMAVNKKLMRKIPGRIVGQTEDVDGKRAYVLTLQAREQHIRREKATSNICSNQALNALAATIYLSTLGKEGIKEVAMQCMKKAHYAYESMIKSGKYQPVFHKPFFKEFVVTSSFNYKDINDTLLNNNIIGGYNLSNIDSKYNNSILYCVTEKRTKQEIDNLVDALEGIE